MQCPRFSESGASDRDCGWRNGKIDRANLQEALRGRRDLHASQPRVVSLTNTTELGTLYRPNQIAELADLAKSKGLAVHVDGARFANAVASAGCTPAELTWKAGVDVLVFGGTKNGLAFGEAVVFFNNQAAADFMYRMKQSGQLASKMRLLAAQWLGLFEGGKWLEYARHANAMAERLSSQLGQVETVKLLFPREGNAVFAKIPEPIVDSLYRRRLAFLYRCWSRGWSSPDVFLGHHRRRCRPFHGRPPNRHLKYVMRPALPPSGA